MKIIIYPNILGIFIVSPLWGMISARLFLQSWLAFISSIINLIGLVKGEVERKTTILGFGVGQFQAVLFSFLIWLGNYLLTQVLLFGYTQAESIIYWIFAGLSFLYMLPQIPNRIKKAWKMATERGFIEAEMMERKLREWKVKIKENRIFKPKIAPLSGQELYELTKQFTGLEGKLIFVLGTPEATVLSVYDVYTWHKWMYEWYDEGKHYEAVIKSRMYPHQQEQDLLDKASKIKKIEDFIKLILQAENQTLSDNEVISPIEKYNKTRGRVYKREPK